MTTGLRLAVVGATGTLGRELVGVLEQEGPTVSELRVYAGDRSLGASVDFQGEPLPVETGLPELVGLDAVVLCTPPDAALDLVRLALRAEVLCLDCSGALVASSDVPAVIADLGHHDRVAGAPLLTLPAGPALAWAPVLSALQRAAGLARVVGTVLQSASAAGRDGIESLSEQTIGLLNQHPRYDLQTPSGPAAFDCLPGSTDEDDTAAKDGLSAAEAGLAAALRRLLGPDVELALTSVMVPAFAGEGSVLAVELDRAVGLDEARELLAAAEGVSLWEDGTGPSTRDAVGSDEVLVGRLRAAGGGDGPGTLHMWLAADPVRLAASNVVKLLRTRFDAR